MRHPGVTLGALLACAFGAWLMATALFGHGWLVGERQGLEVQGGVIDVHLCSKRGDPDPLPMGIGDLDGCTSEMYGRSELRNEAGSWFGATTHMTLVCGAGSVLFFSLLVLIHGLGMRVGVASWNEPLAMQLFDVEKGTVWVRAHPGALGARLGITALVALAIAQGSAPETLGAGPDVLRFVAGSLLAIAAGVVIDPGTLPVPVPARPVAEEVAADAEPTTPLAEAEIEDSDTPTCVRCSGVTKWLDAPGRHRCQKCGLYQPLHPPGSRVDA